MEVREAHASIIGPSPRAVPFYPRAMEEGTPQRDVAYRHDFEPTGMGKNEFGVRTDISVASDYSRRKDFI